jgi:hypothetical protein
MGYNSLAQHNFIERHKLVGISNGGLS